MAAPARAYATRFAQKTIKKFLDAAEDVFGRHGYEGTTIRAISSKARVNLGTLCNTTGEASGSCSGNSSSVVSDP